MVRELPEHYHRGWRHIESVDPALKSALGLTIWAEDPQDGKWYCIIADYIKGISTPTLLVEEVRKRTASFNIVRRIADPHEVWYINTAAQYRLSYIGVYHKSNRKGELIKGLQEKLGKHIFLTPNCEHLIRELQECRWSDRADGRIINSSSWHLLDSSQYFCDNIPKTQVDIAQNFTAGNFHQWIYSENEKRKKKEQDQRQKLDRQMEKRQGRLILRRKSALWT